MDPQHNTHFGIYVVVFVTIVALSAIALWVFRSPARTTTTSLSTLESIFLTQTNTQNESSPRGRQNIFGTSDGAELKTAPQENTLSLFQLATAIDTYKRDNGKYPSLSVLENEGYFGDYNLDLDNKLYSASNADAFGGPYFSACEWDGEYSFLCYSSDLGLDNPYSFTVSTAVTPSKFWARFYWVADDPSYTLRIPYPEGWEKDFSSGPLGSINLVGKDRRGNSVGIVHIGMIRYLYDTSMQFDSYGATFDSYARNYQKKWSLQRKMSISSTTKSTLNNLPAYWLYGTQEFDSLIYSSAILLIDRDDSMLELRIYVERGSAGPLFDIIPQIIDGISVGVER